MKKLNIFLAIFFALGLNANIFNIIDSKGFSIAYPTEPNDFALEENQKEALLHNFRYNLSEFKKERIPIFNTFVSLLSQKETTYKDLHNFVAASNKIHPLFTSSECGSTTKLIACPLGRKEDSTTCPRANFLNRVIAESQHGLGENIIFYASGAFLFEIQLLIELLAAGKEIKNIYFIDPENEALSAENFEFLEENIKKYRRLNKSILTPSDLRQMHRAIQIANVIWAFNPEIKLHFYSDYKTYFEELNNGHPPANALIAMDPTYINSKGQIFHDDLKQELIELRAHLADNALVGLLYRDLSDVFNHLFEVKLVLERHQSNEQICSFCISKAESICSRCQDTFYCKKQCQRAHWKIHKQTCQPKQQ